MEDLHSYISIAESILLPRFARMPLSSIGPADIEELLQARAGRGAAPGTLNRYLATVSSIFTYAVRLKCAARNPVREVERAKETIPPIRYLSEEEAIRLVAALPGWLRVPVLVALDAGLRAGEIAALTRRDVDLDRGLISVRVSKNRQPRHVGITQRLRRAFVGHLANLPKGQKYQFLLPNGGPFSRHGYRYDFRTATRRVGIEGFRFHDLRHACGVRLAEAGATPGEISAYLGHKTLAMTLRYIRHAPRDAGRQLARLLDKGRKDPGDDATGTATG